MYNAGLVRHYIQIISFYSYYSIFRSIGIPPLSLDEGKNFRNLKKITSYAACMAAGREGWELIWYYRYISCSFCAISCCLFG